MSLFTLVNHLSIFSRYADYQGYGHIVFKECQECILKKAHFFSLMIPPGVLSMHEEVSCTLVKVKIIFLLFKNNVI